MRVSTGTAVGFLVLAIPPLMSLAGCDAGKPPFSVAAFELARQQCGANEAYILKSVPNTIGFHGTADEHIDHARCMQQKLEGTDVQIVVIGSRLYEN
jgi:alpha-D-ribose 1-methylphosphonate 5-phosphate C-P lyase